MKTSKGISKRIRITKSGKIIRRARGLGHSRANKNRKQTLRRRGSRSLYATSRNIAKDISNY